MFEDAEVFGKDAYWIGYFLGFYVECEFDFWVVFSLVLDTEALKPKTLAGLKMVVQASFFAT